MLLTVHQCERRTFRYMAHIMLTAQQAHKMKQAMSELDSSTAYMVFDFKQKFVAKRFREGDDSYYGKRGMLWWRAGVYVKPDTGQDDRSTESIEDHNVEIDFTAERVQLRQQVETVEMMNKGNVLDDGEEDIMDDDGEEDSGVDGVEECVWEGDDDHVEEGLEEGVWEVVEDHGEEGVEKGVWEGEEDHGEKGAEDGVLDVEEDNGVKEDDKENGEEDGVVEKDCIDEDGEQYEKFEEENDEEDGEEEEEDSIIAEEVILHFFDCCSRRTEGRWQCCVIMLGSRPSCIETAISPRFQDHSTKQLASKPSCSCHICAQLQGSS